MAKGKNKGYIKVSRDFMYHPLYSNGTPFTLKEVFIDLNLRAFYQDTTKPYLNTIHTYLRGQVEGSYRQMAEWWSMSTDTVKKRLDALEEAGYLYRSEVKGRTVINLLEYCVEQDNSGLGAYKDSDKDSDTESYKNTDKVSDKDSDNYKKSEEIMDKSKKKSKRKPAAQRDFFWEVKYEE